MVTVSIANSFAAKHKRSVDAGQELVALGEPSITPPLSLCTCYPIGCGIHLFAFFVIASSVWNSLQDSLSICSFPQSSIFMADSTAIPHEKGQLGRWSDAKVPSDNPP